MSHCHSPITASWIAASGVLLLKLEFSRTAGSRLGNVGRSERVAPLVLQMREAHRPKRPRRTRWNIRRGRLRGAVHARSAANSAALRSAWRRNSAACLNSSASRAEASNSLARLCCSSSLSLKANSWRNSARNADALARLCCSISWRNSASRARKCCSKRALSSSRAD